MAMPKRDDIDRPHRSPDLTIPDTLLTINELKMKHHTEIIARTFEMINKLMKEFVSF